MSVCRNDFYVGNIVQFQIHRGGSLVYGQICGMTKNLLSVNLYKEIQMENEKVYQKTNAFVDLDKSDAQTGFACRQYYGKEKTRKSELWEIADLG